MRNFGNLSGATIKPISVLKIEENGIKVMIVELKEDQKGLIIKCQNCQKRVVSDFQWCPTKGIHYWQSKCPECNTYNLRHIPKWAKKKVKPTIIERSPGTNLMAAIFSEPEGIYLEDKDLYEEAGGERLSDTNRPVWVY